MLMSRENLKNLKAEKIIASLDHFGTDRDLVDLISHRLEIKT